MLTAHLIARQAIELELPRASQSTALPPTTLAIALKADGAICFEHVQARPEDGFLGHARQLQLLRAPDFAVICGGDAVDELQQARFPGAIAPDQADALARFDHQIDMIEQRHMAESQ